MDKRTLLAVVISLTIWLGWQKYYWEPYQRAQKEWQQSQEEARQANAALTEPSAKIDSAPTTTEKSSKTTDVALAKSEAITTTELNLAGQSIKVTNSRALLQGWLLKDFKTSDQDESKRHDIDLKYVTGMDSQLVLGFSDQALTKELGQNFQTTKNLAAGQLYADTLASESLSVQRELSADKVAHTLNLNMKIRFKREVPKFIYLDLFGAVKREHDKPGSIFGEHPDKVEVTYWNTAGRHSVIAEQVREKTETSAGAYWLGLNTRYFLLAAVPEGKELIDHTGVQIQAGAVSGANVAEGRLVFPTDGKAEINLPLKVYFGPKQLEILEGVAPALRHAVDFGWTSPIAIPLLKMLQMVYSVVHNYGVAIIVVTIFVKILLFPLTYKSMKSMAQLSKLRPQMERLQKKYADDKQKLQQEIWNLYKSNGANPLSGCLPLLLQMPVFFALYRVLFNCMELYQAPFAFWIRDLSDKDPWFVTPVLLIGLMYFQQKLTPTANADPSQQAVMKVMPVMFGVFMIFLPSGLNIYMLVNTAISIAQQVVLNRKFGLHQPLTGATTNSDPVAKPT